MTRGIEKGEQVEEKKKRELLGNVLEQIMLCTYEYVVVNPTSIYNYNALIKTLTITFI